MLLRWVSCRNSNKDDLEESVHLVTGEAERVSRFVERIRPRNLLRAGKLEVRQAWLY